MSEELVRLEPDSNRKPFDCDDDDLNDFFHVDSIKHSKDLFAVTYALQTEDVTKAFFCVANDSIRSDDTANTLWKRLVSNVYRKKHYVAPSVKVGRFAVHKDYQKQGLGSNLMSYIKLYFLDKNKTGCRFIIVDAYKQSLGFYEKNGFNFLSKHDAGKDSSIMYYDLILFRDHLSKINKETLE